MAQHDYVIANGTGAAVRSDLNNALAAIVSNNSGATTPATTYAYQWWADTTTGTLKLRNSANSAWIELMQLDGTLTMEDGTEALPGLSFRSDLDTGLFRPGANQLAISTNAVERVEFGASEVVFNDGGANYDFRVEGDTNANLLFVDASADAVGIGTQSPASIFHVSGSADQTYTFQTTTSGADNRINFRNSAGTDAGGIHYMHGGNHLLFNTGGSNQEKARIDGSGRLLVGTSTSIDGWKQQIVDSDTQNFSVFTGRADVLGPRIGLKKSRGSTASPSIVSSGDAVGTVAFFGYDGSTYIDAATIRAEVDGTPGANDMPGRLVFSTTRDGQSSPSEAARILSDQTILVGKTAADGTSTGITLGGANSGAAGQVLAVSSADAGIFYRKTSSGSDGVILTKSDVGGTNTLVGAGYANGTFGAVSDATKKKNIETARNYLDDIKNIRVVKYNWNTDEDGTPKELGWIAQEVEQVFPGMVTEMEGAKLLKKEVFVPMLMKCIQEQQAIIENLEARLTALESA